MPNIFRALGYDFFFWSNEYSGNELEPFHIHVGKQKSQKSPKVWISRHGDIQWAYGEDEIPQHIRTKIEQIIRDNYMLFIEDWYNHFGEYPEFIDKVFGEN